jgi:hypothetical protein
MLVFIHINKTAGSTLRYILRSTYGPRHCEVEPWQTGANGAPFSSQDLQRLRKIYPRLESIAGHRITGYIDLQDNGDQFKYFTFLRDPVKTCASRFQYNIQYRGKKELVFEEWIQKDWTRNAQTRLIAGVEDYRQAVQIIQKKAIFVGLTERFDESLLMLKALVENGLNIAYRRVNVANHNSIAKDLLANPRTRQMLVDANQADLQLYDHVSKELYPAQQEKYGPSLQDDLLKFQQSRENNFNNLNLTLSRLKQYLLYRPVIYLYQRDIKFV